jgi:cell division protein ZipA
MTIPSTLAAGDYTVIVTGTAGSTVHSDEITFTLTSIPEFSLDIENREQIIEDGTMSISGVIDAHNGLDLALGGALDVLVEPYNQELLDSAVITWGSIDSNGDLPFTVTFTVDDSIPRNEYTINLNVVSLDGGLAHSASVAFVTESSTLDGTAVAADSSAVSSGNTSQHDGTDSSATTIANGESDDDKDDESDADSKSSNTGLIVGSTIGVIGIIAGVAVVVLRGRNGGENKDFTQPMWNDQSGMVNQMPVAGAPQMMQQPMMQQPVQPMQQQPIQQMPQQTMQEMAQPVQQQPVQQQPIQQMPQQPVQQQPVQPVQPVAPAPVSEMTTAPPPPAQPMTVADYTGLPAGGQYDQSTGQTIYVQTDGTRWQMMGDGSFNRL